MAVDGVQQLDLKNLDAVFTRANAEGWTELALVGPAPLAEHRVRWLVRNGWSTDRVFLLPRPIDRLPLAVASLTNLTSLYLALNKIGHAGAEIIVSLTGLTSLDLEGNRLGDAGAKAISNLTSLNSLNLGVNEIGDVGAEAIARLGGLTSLRLWNNQIGNAGAEAIAGLPRLVSLSLRNNLIGDAGAAAIARHPGLTSLSLQKNRIAETGARAILDAWADLPAADHKHYLDLRENGDLSGLLPAEVLQQTVAQMTIAAWRRRKAQEGGWLPLPTPEALGEPTRFGAEVGNASDRRLTLVDPAFAASARDDEIGRELHSEAILALDRLIASAGRSNAVAEWREPAEAAKERLGSGPREVRVSAILRIERLRSLREADERRRSEADPLVEPAEAGVAAALRDAVAAANLYVEADPYLAEQQRRLADPGLDLAISTEEAAAAEAELDDLDIADPALLAELRLGRETAAAGGRAGERALAWLAGSWRNVVREMLRQVLAWVREQVKAARASAGEAAMQAKLGAVITVGEAAAVLASIGLYGKNAATETARASAAGLRRTGRAFATGAGVTAGSVAVVGMLAFLEQQFALLARLGWQADFTALLARVLGM